MQLCIRSDLAVDVLIYLCIQWYMRHISYWDCSGINPLERPCFGTGRLSNCPTDEESRESTSQ